MSLIFQYGAHDTQPEDCDQVPGSTQASASTGSGWQVEDCEGGTEKKAVQAIAYTQVSGAPEESKIGRISIGLAMGRATGSQAQGSRSKPISHGGETVSSEPDGRGGSACSL